MFRELVAVLLILHPACLTDLPFEVDNLIPPWESFKTKTLVDEDSFDFQGTGRIINGLSAAVGQFPYTVFLILEFPDKKTWCGGSLIRRNWILTAAHCLSNVLNGTAVIGGTTFIKFGKTEWYGIFNQSQMFIHPEYNSDGLFSDNDIALIKLLNEIPCTKNFGTIDLPCGCDFEYDLAGEEVQIAGYGYTGFNDSKPILPTTLKYVHMEVMENCVCNKFFKRGNLSIIDSMLCTRTDKGMSTCRGDSGSGLVAKISDRNVLVGVVSFGDKMCTLGAPNVYTRVSSFIPWIKQTMRAN